MQEQETEFSDTRQRMVSGFKRLVADAEALLRGGSDAAGEGLETARASARDVLGRMRERVAGLRGTLAEVEDTALDRYRDTADRTLEYVRAHPGRALGVVLVIGVLLGTLLGKRR